MDRSNILPEGFEIMKTMNRFASNPVTWAIESQKCLK